jgi:hypothetical protein
MRVQVHPRAWDELVEAAQYYEDRRDGKGEEFFNEVERLKSILCDVQLGPRIDTRHRKAPLQGFPYSIIDRSESSNLLLTLQSPTTADGHSGSTVNAPSSL